MNTDQREKQAVLRKQLAVNKRSVGFLCNLFSLQR